MAGCRLLVVLVAASLLCGVSAVNETSGVGPLVDFLPAKIDGLVLGSTATIDVETTSQLTGSRRLRCVVLNPDIVELVHGGSVTVCAGLPANATRPHLTVRGLRMGRTIIDCLIDDGVRGHDNATTWMPMSSKRVMIAVVREPHVLDKFFFALIPFIVVCVNVGMGCAIDLKVVMEVLRRPVAPAIGFFSQFLVMPLVSNIIAYQRRSWLVNTN